MVIFSYLPKCILGNLENFFCIYKDPKKMYKKRPNIVDTQCPSDVLSTLFDRYGRWMDVKATYIDYHFSSIWYDSGCDSNSQPPVLVASALPLHCFRVIVNDRLKNMNSKKSSRHHQLHNNCITKCEKYLSVKEETDKMNRTKQNFKKKRKEKIEIRKLTVL